MITMTQEERKKKALDFIESNKESHVSEWYGPDCRVYKDYSDVVSITIAKLAIEIALGER